MSKTNRNKEVLDDYITSKNMELTGNKFGITRQRVQQIIKTFGYKKPPKYIPSKEEKEAIKIHKNIQLFWSKIDKKSDEECWEWIAGKFPSGYGRSYSIQPFTNKKYAHRTAWILTHGEIPDGMVICHKCDNPPCCNPNHLYLGTQADNVRDRQERFYKNGLIPLHKKDRVS